MKKNYILVDNHGKQACIAVENIIRISSDRPNYVDIYLRNINNASIERIPASNSFDSFVSNFTMNSDFIDILSINGVRHLVCRDAIVLVCESNDRKTSNIYLEDGSVINTKQKCQDIVISIPIDYK